MARVELPGITKDQVGADTPLLLYPGGIESSRHRAIQFGRKDAPVTRINAYFDTDALLGAVPGMGQVDLQLVGQLINNEYYQGSDAVMIKQRQTGGGGQPVEGDDPDDINDEDIHHDPD
jgi:hypothetical protein